MICVGERLGQRDAGDAEAVVTSQLEGSIPPAVTPDRLTIAYEPVWAIGTGKVAGVDEITAMHAAIRNWLAGRGLGQVPVLYGGSSLAMRTRFSPLAMLAEPLSAGPA